MRRSGLTAARLCAALGLLGTDVGAAEAPALREDSLTFVERNDGPLPYLEILDPVPVGGSPIIRFFSEDVILFDGSTRADFERTRKGSYAFGENKGVGGRIQDIIGAPGVTRMFAVNLATRTVQSFPADAVCTNPRTGDFILKDEAAGLFYLGRARSLTDLAQRKAHTVVVEKEKRTLDGRPVRHLSMIAREGICREVERREAPGDWPGPEKPSPLHRFDGYSLPGGPSARKDIIDPDGRVVMRIERHRKFSRVQLAYDGRYFVHDSAVSRAVYHAFGDEWRASNCAWLMLFTVAGAREERCIPYVPSGEEIAVAKGGVMVYAHDERGNPELGATGVYWAPFDAPRSIRLVTGEVPWMGSNGIWVSPSGCRVVVAVQPPRPRDDWAGFLAAPFDALLSNSYWRFKQRNAGLNPPRFQIYDVCAPVNRAALEGDRP